MIIMFIFEVLIGVMLILDGEKFTQVVFIIFGVAMLICGLITLIRGLLDGRNGGTVSGVKMFFAIVLLAIGVFFTAASGSIKSFMTTVWVVIGIIMAFSGMLKLMGYVSMRKQGEGAVLAIIGAIITIILGIVIAFNPFQSAATMWVIIGILIIVSAVFDLIFMISFTASMKKNVNTTVIEIEAKDVKDKE